MNLLLIKWYFTISYTANMEWSCSYSPSRRWIRIPPSVLNKDAVSSDHTLDKSCKLCRLLPWLETIPCPLRGDPQEGHSLLWYSFPMLKTEFIKSEKQQTSPSLELLYNKFVQHCMRLTISLKKKNCRSHDNKMQHSCLDWIFGEKVDISGKMGEIQVSVV